MRFSLIDLLMMTACITLGLVSVTSVLHLLGVEPVSKALMPILGVPVGIIFFLILTPPLYQRLRLLPLFLPVCPHCKLRPGSYRILESVYPKALVACGRCERTSELWWRKPAISDVSKTMPSLLLSWPHSVGRWRQISSGGLT
jgi:hypothetical protein